MPLEAHFHQRGLYTTLISTINLMMHMKMRNTTVTGHLRSCLLLYSLELQCLHSYYGSSSLVLSYPIKLVEMP